MKAAKQKKIENDRVELETVVGKLEAGLVELSLKVEAANQRLEKPESS